MTRFDRWSKDNMPTPGSDEFRRIQAGIADTMKGIVANAHIPTSASMIPDSQRAAETPRPPSGGTAPLTSPPGVDHIDRIAESFAHQDKIAAVRKKLEDAEIERRLSRTNPYNPKDRDPYKAKTAYDPLEKFDRSMPSLHRDKDE